jgi:hypothetical protein
MKNFIICYVFSLSLMVYVWLPDVIVRPFYIIPRLAFYMAFPVAVFISISLIILGSYFGILKSKKISEDLATYKPAKTTLQNKEIKYG